MSEPSPETLLGGSPLFRELPTPELTGLAAAGSIKRYRPNSYLFHQGERPSEVYLLMEGRVEIRSSAPQGREQLHAMLSPPHLFGEIGVLANRQRTASALAAESTSAWALDASRFLDFVTSRPPVAQALLATLAGQFIEHEYFVEDLLFLDLKGRVAKRLLALASGPRSDPPSDGAVLTLDLTHEDLASLCGGTRANVSRILSDFQRRGFIQRDGRRYRFLDVRGLAGLTGVSASMTALPTAE